MERNAISISQPFSAPPTQEKRSKCNGMAGAASDEASDASYGGVLVFVVVNVPRMELEKAAGKISYGFVISPGFRHCAPGFCSRVHCTRLDCNQSKFG